MTVFRSHLQILNCIEQRLDAFLNADQDMYSLTIAGFVSGLGFHIHATIDYSKAYLKYNILGSTPSECVSTQDEIRVFFESFDENTNSSKRSDFVRKDSFDVDCFVLKTCNGDKSKALSFKK